MPDTAITDTHCPTLPSSESAYNFIQGRPGSTIRLVRDLFARAALVGVGMAVAGEREHLFRNAFAGAVGIEVFVLGWVWLNAPPATAQTPAGALPNRGGGTNWYAIPTFMVKAYQPYLPIACSRVSTPYWPYFEELYCVQTATPPWTVTRLGQVIWHGPK